MAEIRSLISPAQGRGQCYPIRDDTLETCIVNWHLCAWDRVIRMDNLEFSLRVYETEVKLPESLTEVARAEYGVQGKGTIVVLCTRQL